MTLLQAGNMAQLLVFPLAILVWLVTQRIAPRFWKRWARSILAVSAVVTLFGLWRLRILDSLGGRVHLPGWMMLGLGLLAVLAGLFLRSLMRSNTWERDWRDYISDEMFGVVWHWRYIRNEVPEHHLSPFCPEQQCGCRLQSRANPERRGPQPAAVPVFLLCPRCGFKREFDSGFDGLKAKVVAEIENRLRTGEYQKRLDRLGRGA
jgi:hypothetical protein